jgi:hypothetical protein
MRLPLGLLALSIALAGARPAHALNLLVNGGFDDAPDVGWQCTPLAGCTHAAEDVDDDPASGSALLATEAAASAGVELDQCIAVDPATDYDFAAWGLVSAANPVTTILRIRMTWYEGASCSGDLIYGEVLANASEIGVWTPMMRGRPSPPNAASGRFTVQFIKSPSASGLASARVDAVSVPEPTAAARACAALAALAGVARTNRARPFPLSGRRRRAPAARG